MDNEKREQRLDELSLMINFLKGNPNISLPHQFTDREYTVIVDSNKSQKEQFDLALDILGKDNISCWDSMITLRKRFGDIVSISQYFMKDSLYIMKRRHDPELDNLLENICTKANAPESKETI